MFAQQFLFGAGTEYRPDGLHLNAAVHRPHQAVVERVTVGVATLGPEESFGRVGEATAREVRWRIRFLPGDVVQEV